MRRLASMALLLLGSSSCLNTSEERACELYPELCTLAITSVSPLSGPSAGGTEITVTGTGFDQDTLVDLDGLQTILSRDNGRLVFRTEPHLPERVFLRVSNSLGTVAFATQYQFVAAPALTSVSPDSGARSGGVELTLTGQNLAGAEVRIGGVVAEVLSSSVDFLLVRTPSLAAGPHNVTVATAGGTSVLQNAFHALTWSGSSEGWEEAPGIQLASGAGGSPLYLTVVGGETYRASSAGSPWSPVFNRRAEFQHWLAVSPTDPLRVVSAASDGLLLTTDGFATSARSVSNVPVLRGVVFNSTGTRVFASSFGGILISRDAGESFSVFTTDGEVNSVAAALDDPNVVAAITASSLYTSLDGGETWSQRALPPGPYFRVTVSALRAVVSSDSGSRIFPTVAGTPSEACVTDSVFAFAEDPAQPGRLWVSAGPNKVGYTDTTANSCTALSGVETLPFGSASELLRAADELVALDTLAVHHRELPGGGWTEMSSGLASPRLTAIASQHLGSVRILFAYSERGQVYRRTGGGQWTPYGPRTSSNPAPRFLFATPEGSGFRLLTADLGGLKTLAPNGSAWTTPTGISGSPLAAAEDVLDPALVHPLIVSTTDGVFLSANGGQTFTSVTRDLPSGVNLAYLSVADGSYYGSSFDGRAFSTPAGGSSWTAFPAFITEEPAVRGFLRTEDGLLLSNQNSGVYRLDDGAAAWVQVADGATDLFAVDPRARSTVYAARSGSLHRSTDRGSTWESVDDGTLTPGLLQGAVVDTVEEGRVYLLGSSFRESPVGGP